MRMKTLGLPAAGLAVLAALSAGKASAHHESGGESGGRHYLAFWSGYRLPSTPSPDPATCQDGDFWEKGFVSIYSQGAE